MTMPVRPVRVRAGIVEHTLHCNQDRPGVAWFTGPGVNARAYFGCADN
jgi:hypothetical protein